MRLPDFLVIGAMKCGTTGFCADLRANPQVFFPSVKEPKCLISDDVLTPAGTNRYAEFFSRAQPEQTRCGEGSTEYTKLPCLQGVPERARNVLGESVKLIYVVREPVSRAISHHHHLYRGGGAPADVNQAIRSLNGLIDYGLYAMQLEPWLDVFGRENLLVIRFEDYTADRVGAIVTASEFLGVEPRPDLADTTRVYNSASDFRTGETWFSGAIHGLRKTRWYKTQLHPRIPHWVRDGFKTAFRRKPPAKPAAPSIDTVDFIIERVREDAERLREIMGRVQPLWDFEETRCRFLTRDATAS